MMKKGVIVNSNYTNFFREDMDWDKFITIVLKRFKNGGQVFCYGCSDGSEPFSLAIKLISTIGKEAEKFFPILAFDKDHKIISRVKSGIIGLKEKDLHRIQKHLSGSKFNLQDFFKKAGNIPIEKIPEDLKEDILPFRVNSPLKHSVVFNVGDISLDAKHTFPKNTLLFFRNAWPYLKLNQEQELANDLFQSLPSRSIVTVGAFDQNYSYAPDVLINRGFKTIDKGAIITGPNAHFVKSKYPSDVEYIKRKFLHGIFERP